MAKVVKCSNPEFWEIKFETGGRGVMGCLDDHFKKTGSEYDRLVEESDRIHKEGKTLVGLVVSFPVADGIASYRVTKEKPLTLEHIPYGDAWQVPAYQLRGLTAKDIRALSAPWGW